MKHPELSGSYAPEVQYVLAESSETPGQLVILVQNVFTDHLGNPITEDEPLIVDESGTFACRCRNPDQFDINLRLNDDGTLYV